MAERELVEDVSLCASDGQLNPEAVGWSRRPIHRGALRGPWPRRKRWDYWAVTTERHLLFLLQVDHPDALVAAYQDPGNPHAQR
jgi:Protein of unknown function (DUF2804)